MWGTLNLYLVSYLKMYDDSIEVVDGFFCMGIAIFFTNIASSLGIYIEKRIGYRKTTLIGVFLIIVGYSLIYFSKSIILDYFLIAFIGTSCALIVRDTILYY